MAFGKDRKNEAVFLAQVKHYSTPVLDMCRYALRASFGPEFPGREYLNLLRGSTTRLQEFLDHHGAQHSETWFPFRESIAAAKLFSTVCYALRHVRGSLKHYVLKDIDSNCRSGMDQILNAMKDALLNISQGILEQAERCGIDYIETEPLFLPHSDPRFDYRLKPDRNVRHVEKVGEAVVYIATKFLNLAEDRGVRAVLREHDDTPRTDLVPEPISEESLRTVESLFHNLQSFYDTYLFESDVEQQNEDLPYLRGHISIIYHLMEVATNLIHYYVRHMSSLSRDSRTEFRFPMGPDELVNLVFDVPVKFSRLYLESAVQLCQKMIQSYSVQAEIDVPIPYYRGFHVRPSTLIASIVAHYGSSVTMELNGQEYDAGLPLELFRANEEINALKRRFVADLLSKDSRLDHPVPPEAGERIQEIQLLLVRLSNEDKIVMYDTDLGIDPDEDVPESTIAEYAVRLIRHLISVAKMDVRSDITVKFSGDNRALNDLGILAGNGYGEDQMGNNIVLPDELSYLSR